MTDVEPTPLRWCGRPWRLFPDGSLLLDDAGVLFAADLHLGKGSTFRDRGIPVPRGASADDLGRLAATVRTASAELVVLLGDLLHARSSRSPHVLDALARWREAVDTEVLLVRGNHDAHAGDPPGSVDIRVVDPPFEVAGVQARHEPPAAVGGEGRATEDRANESEGQCAAGGETAHPVLAGHLHPVVRLQGPGGDRARLPCFWIRADSIVLPAYGTFTGGQVVRPGPDDRVLVPLPEGVVEVSGRARP